MMTYEMSRAPYCDENYMNQTGKEPMNAPAAARNAIVSVVPNKAVGYAEEHPKERHHPRSADSMTDARTLVDTGNCCISFDHLSIVATATVEYRTCASAQRRITALVPCSGDVRTAAPSVSLPPSLVGVHSGQTGQMVDGSTKREVLSVCR